MNILFLTLAYHPQSLAEVTRASRDGLQNQINNYQWAFMEGLRSSMGNTGVLSVCNALPVGIFPLRYRKAFLPSRRFEAHFQELGCINLPWVKQRARQKKALRAIKAWAAANPNNRSILLYSLYLPYMRAIADAKKCFPDLKATVIVTDLPNEMGIASGRKGFLKAAEYAMGREKIELCTAFDGFVLLTRHMAEVLPIEGKGQCVMEGLILPQPGEATPADAVEDEPKATPVVLYSGTLNRELGIGELLKAFALMPEYTLWLCGRGDMEKEVESACKAHNNIRYFGFVSHGKALRLQNQADALINPRSSAGLFTRYSFPSKTLEYMRSGKPVLCYQLEGIPADYDPFLTYIQPDEGIAAAVRSVLTLSEQDRQKIGEAAKNYVLAEKNASTQCQKLFQFLQALQEPGKKNK